MVFDIVRTIFQAAVALGHIRDEQVLNKRFGILIEVSWELDLSLQDLLINGHGIIVIERINSCYHLVSQNAERPPINWLSVTLIKKHLRS